MSLGDLCKGRKGLINRSIVDLFILTLQKMKQIDFEQKYLWQKTLLMHQLPSL